VCTVAMTTLAGLANDETRTDRLGRDMALTRLLEVPMSETLRSTTGPAVPPDLLRGLCGDRL